MIRNIAFIAGTAALSVLGGCVEDTGGTTAAAPTVGNSTDLASFEGARAGQAEMGIQNLGYEAIRSDGLTTWWFNRATGACAKIVTDNGRYSSVTMLPAEDC